MRILFVDSKTKGHHVEYIRELACDERYQSIIIMPEDPDIDLTGFGADTVFVPMTEGCYSKRMAQIEIVADEYSVDIVHFVYADSVLKYFGFGIGRLKKYKTIVTFHQFRYSRLRNMSRKIIFSMVDAGVVHTEHMLSFLKAQGIKNGVHIEYPKFGAVCTCDKDEARKQLGIKTEYPVLLSLGGTRFEKGLDLLLDALGHVHERFYLLVAGPAQDFDEEFIMAASEDYSENVKLMLRFIPYKEFILCSRACDFVILPYKKSFDGASGPLVEGVIYQKPIIGAGHGSLGEIIRNNHLGYTFEAENRDQLVKVLDKALSSSFEYDETAKSYAEKLNPKFFRDAYYKLYIE